MQALGLVAALLLFAGAPQQVRSPHDLSVGDPVRRSLLDALRPEIERDLGQKVRFVVETLRVQDNWAFAVVAPRTPGGAKIDFARTHHAERQRAGVLDGDTIYALLERRSGRWSVRSFAIGPTDVAWADWSDEFGAPEALLGLPEQR